MPNRTISKAKQVAIGHLVLNGNINLRKSARGLRISRVTLKRYVKKYTPLALTHNDQCFEDNFCIPVFNPSIPFSEKHKELFDVLPALVDSREVNDNISVLWQKYLAICPNGYRYSQFSAICSKWCKERKIVLNARWKLLSVPPEDLAVFRQWRRSADRRKWERSVAIIEFKKGSSFTTISRKIERPINKMRDWIRSYKANGIEGLKKKPRNPNPEILSQMAQKRTNLIMLIHESPKLHGINRTSWFLIDLSLTYQKVYGVNMSKSTISSYLKKEGYVYRKAREVLTSPDPDFREKLAKITNILSHLGTNERFFSVDEFGPFAVKMKGGRSLVKKGEQKTFPQIQKSKGFTICTAALELSTNQITHFYSQKKDSEEMIKLIELLLVVYKKQDKLYFSWDAASWHVSKRLIAFVDRINTEQYRWGHQTPCVELAPLPASAQFLNVIESVFSGLAKSVIHNSDYESLDECKTAIDLYFKRRNDFFLLHPKRAGNKIWGKELVVPIFKVDHNCKDPRYR